MAAREATITLAAIALVAAGAQAGLFAPAGNVLSDPRVSFEEMTVDEAGTCPGGLEVGVAAVDISPYDPMSWNEVYTDANGNGVYDGPDPLSGTPGEPYEDANANGKFDGLFMAGYGHEKGGNEYYMAKEVHDPVWARALAVTCGDATLGMVSVDTVGLFSNAVDDIRSGADAGFDHVLVASTHTHDSIDTMGLWGPSLFVDGKHPALMEHYKSGAVDALDQALATQRTVDHVQVTTQLTRDLIDDAGTVQTDLRDPFVIDDRILAQRFATANDETIATLVNWAPHPETLAGTKSEISSDYAHYLREALESDGATVGGEYVGPTGGTAVFFSGAVGGMMTTLGADPLDATGTSPVPDHSYEKTERIGDTAAWAILKGLETAPELPADGLRIQAAETNVPGDNAFLLALNTIGIFDHPLAVGPTEAPPVGPTGIVAPSPFFRAEVNAITFESQGEDLLQILTSPGELLPEVALGNPLSHDPHATLDKCWALNPLKVLFNDDREARPNPAKDGKIEKGFERQLASNPDIPKEPAFLRNATASYVMLFGLANDELGYIVPADDYVYPTVFPDVYSDGTDRCGDDDHYEETVSASSYLAPAVANTISKLLDPTFEPEPYPTRIAGPTEEDGSAPELDEWKVSETNGVWVDTSRSGGYEAQEDAHVRVSLPTGLSGCWGFVNGFGQPIGQTPSEEARGMWIDLDGDCTYEDHDGLIFADAWALSEGQPYWRPS